MGGRAVARDTLRLDGGRLACGATALMLARLGDGTRRRRRENGTAGAS